MPYSFSVLSLWVSSGTLFLPSRVLSGVYSYAAYALHGAIGFFLLPVFLGVTTRMVPFFSSRVLGPRVDYKPSWARPLLVLGALAHGGLDLAGADGWLWFVDLPMAVVVGTLACKWGLTKSFGARLLAMLHLSLAVLALAFLLSGVLSIAVAGGALGRVGLAPLHLLVVGYFAATVMGMVSRVSLGHSGRALEVDRLTWACYIGVRYGGASRRCGISAGHSGRRLSHGRCGCPVARIVRRLVCALRAHVYHAARGRALTADGLPYA